MLLIKLVFAIIIFATALSVIFMGPERQTEVLEVLGIGLRQRTLFALSILGLVFSTILGIKAVAEKLMMKSS